MACLLISSCVQDKLLNHSGAKLKGNSLSEDQILSSQVGAYFEQLHVLLDLIKNIGECLLQDVLAFNCSVGCQNSIIFV